MNRFISIGFVQLSLLLFVGIFVLGVKEVSAKTVRDQVVSLTLPFEMVLKKTGAVRLAGLLYDADSKALSDYVKVGDKLRVRVINEKPDKYGRKAALVYLDDKRWLQGEMVGEGQAVAYPYEGEEFFIRDLYLLERPKTVSALNDVISAQQFQIVEGLVIGVAEVKGMTYLNFGDNWRTDFTVRIIKKDLKKFRAKSVKLTTLKGRKVRVRGWVIEKNGPLMALEHPAQLEILE